jgi:hypothetical protein
VTERDAQSAFSDGCIQLSVPSCRLRCRWDTHASTHVSHGGPLRGRVGQWRCSLKFAQRTPLFRLAAPIVSPVPSPFSPPPPRALAWRVGAVCVLCCGWRFLSGKDGAQRDTGPEARGGGGREAEGSKEAHVSDRGRRCVSVLWPSCCGCMTACSGISCAIRIHGAAAGRDRPHQFDSEHKHTRTPCAYRGWTAGCLQSPWRPPLWLGRLRCRPLPLRQLRRAASVSNCGSDSKASSSSQSSCRLECTHGLHHWPSSLSDAVPVRR